MTIGSAVLAAIPFCRESRYTNLVQSIGTVIDICLPYLRKVIEIQDAYKLSEDFVTP
jgi:hypothetical protein